MQTVKERAKVTEALELVVNNKEQVLPGLSPNQIKDINSQKLEDLKKQYSNAMVSFNEKRDSMLTIFGTHFTAYIKRHHI